MLTGLIVWGLEALYPSPAIGPPLAVVLGGLVGAGLSSELLFRWIVWRLQRERHVLTRMLTAYDDLHEEFGPRIGERHRRMSEPSGSKKFLTELQRELDALLQAIHRSVAPHPRPAFTHNGPDLGLIVVRGIACHLFTDCGLEDLWPASMS